MTRQKLKMKVLYSIIFLEENMDNSIFEGFSDWLDKILEANSFDKVLAFNFNLYEGITGTKEEWHIQLIGCDEFDEQDQDWACSEIFTTEENLFIMEKRVAGKKWFEALDFSIKIVTEYLENGKNKDILLEKQAVGIGFVDGDLYIIYNNGKVDKNIKVEHDF